jgi:hypothetical protein
MLRFEIIRRKENICRKGSGEGHTGSTVLCHLTGTAGQPQLPVAMQMLEYRRAAEYYPNNFQSWTIWSDVRGQRFTFGPFLLNPDYGTLPRKGEHVAVGRRGMPAGPASGEGHSQSNARQFNR